MVIVLIVLDRESTFNDLSRRVFLLKIVVIDCWADSMTPGRVIDCMFITFSFHLMIGECFHHENELGRLVAPK